MKKWAVMCFAIIGLGCPQVLQDLKSVEGSTAVITSFSPSMGYAAKGEDFAGTLVCINIDGFADDTLDVWFGAQLAGEEKPSDNEICVHVPAGLVGRTSIFVQRTVDGTVLQRAGSSQNFLILDAPVINDISPWEIFGASEQQSTCPADPCAGDSAPPYCADLPMPKTGECQERGGGTMLTLRGESLSSESELENELTEVTLWVSGPSSHAPLQLDQGWFYEDGIELCIPPAAWVGLPTIWNLRVVTPAGARELTTALFSPGCPYAESVDPSAAYQNGVATVFGRGFSNDVDLNAAWLVDDAGGVFAAEVLAASEGALTLQIPEAVVAAGQVFAQTRIIVATPVGRAELETPFVVMGAPEIDWISPDRVFANPPVGSPNEAPDPDPWTVSIEGRGFDISSIAANIVELSLHDDETRPSFFPQVVSVSPVQLVVRMPAEIPEGMYDLWVTTTAGISADRCVDGVLDGQSHNRGCLQVLGTPQIEEVFPSRVTWGDDLALRGGPFDPQGIDQTQVQMRVAGLTLEAEIVSVTLDVMQLRLPPQPDAVPVVSQRIDPGQAVELWVRYAGTDSSTATVHVVDHKNALKTFRVSSTVLHFPSQSWLPSQAWGASGQALWTWIKNDGTRLSVYLASLNMFGISDFVSPVRSYTTSPGGKYLYAAHVQGNAPDVLRRYDLSWELGGPINYDTSDPVDLTGLRGLLGMANEERIVGLATGRSLELQRGEQLALLTESGDASSCYRRQVYITDLRFNASGVLRPPQQSCRLDGYYTQRLDLVRDVQGGEHILAEINLSKGCTRYSQLAGSGTVDAGPAVESGVIVPLPLEAQTLSWACTGDGLSGASGTDCLALVELSCPEPPSNAALADAGVVGVDPTAVSADSRVWIEGLPLPPGSHIVPAAQSMTVLIAASQPLGASADQWGRLVDLDHRLRCEEVLTRCDPGQEGSPPGFAPPFFTSELSAIHQAGLSDPDTAFAVGRVGNSTAGAPLAAVAIAHRWAPDVTWTSPPFASVGLSPIAANGAGLLFFSRGQDSIDDLQVTIKRPQSIELDQFEVDGCWLSSHLWVAPNSQRVVEKGCAELPEATCLVFAGLGYLGQVEDVGNAACTVNSNTRQRLLAGDLGAWCVGLYDDGTLPDLQVLMPSEGVNARAVDVWGDRVCMIDDSADLAESVLDCVSVDEACSAGASVTRLHLGVRLTLPRLTPLMRGRLLITDPMLPDVIIVEPRGRDSSGLVVLARASADALPGGISSVLVRHDREGVVAATAGSLWAVNLVGSGSANMQLNIRRIFANEVLPPVGMTLVQSGSTDQVFLYGAESPDNGARQVLLVLDLAGERVLGQAISVDSHSGAILARHGSSNFLLGRQPPAGVSELSLQEGTLRSWAAMTATPQPTSIDSLWMSTDGRLLLSTDGLGLLWVTY